MRLKLGFLLTVSLLLVCLSACASPNSSNSQTAANATNSTASQSGGVLPARGANEAGAVAAPGASPTVTNGQPAATGIDACALMTNKEVAAIVGGAIKEAKSSQRNDGEFLMSQCFYTAEEFVRSVSLTVVQPDPANPTKQPQQYFTEKFRDVGKKPEAEREKEHAKATKGKKEAGGEHGEEEEEEGGNAERISGLGDQAFWVKSGPSASLYVLKKNQFLILSIGGGDAEPIRLKKTKALAQQALKRMS